MAVDSEKPPDVECRDSRKRLTLFQLGLGQYEAAEDEEGEDGGWGIEERDGERLPWRRGPEILRAMKEQDDKRSNSSNRLQFDRVTFSLDVARDRFDGLRSHRLMLPA